MYTTNKSKKPEQDIKINFDHINETDKSFFTQGLSENNNKLSLCCYEEGTCPSLSTVKSFLQDNPCVTSLELRGAILTASELDSLKVGGVTMVTTPGVSNSSYRLR